MITAKDARRQQAAAIRKNKLEKDAEFEESVKYAKSRVRKELAYKLNEISAELQKAISSGESSIYVYAGDDTFGYEMSKVLHMELRKLGYGVEIRRITGGSYEDTCEIPVPGYSLDISW